MSSGEIKQKIIITTIECIESEGYQNVTIRKIADSAGVNVAAVNYHFGSKDQLLEIAMNTTLNESFVNNINDYKEMWQTDTKQALRNFLIDTMTGAMTYPNLTKAHFSGTFNKNDYSTNAVQSINIFLFELHKLIKDILPSGDEMENKLAIVQIMSSFMMVGMMPKLFNQFLETELSSNETQQKFINLIIKKYTK